MAAAQDWRVDWAETALVNVTGAVLVEVGQSAVRMSGAPDQAAKDARIVVSSGGKS
jgi:hypothetical protein